MRGVVLAICLFGSGACTDYDAYHFTTDTRCGETFVDTSAGQCLPGPPICGCADPTQNCGYAGDSTFVCITPGAGGLNALCDDDLGCQQGFGCAGGLCRRYCSSVDDCTDATGAECKSLFDGDVTLPAKSCFYDCDPVSPDHPLDEQAFVTCGSAATCIISDLRHSACLAGRGTSNDACTDQSDCAPGRDCYDGKCYRYCWTADDGCPAGQTCNALTDDYGDTAILLGVLELGVCL